VADSRALLIDCQFRALKSEHNPDGRQAAQRRDRAQPKSLKNSSVCLQTNYLFACRQIAFQSGDSAAGMFHILLLQATRNVVARDCNFVIAAVTARPEIGRILHGARRAYSGLKFIATPLMQ
jgi:hypothetical protein